MAYQHRTFARATLVLVLLAGACSGEPEGSPPGTAVARWTLEPAPNLRLGDEPSGENEFFRIRDIAALGDGGFLVLNTGTQEVWHFDSTGNRVGTLGGVGEGPGEFQGPIELAVLDDDIVAVYDVVNRRLSRLFLDGGLQRDESFTGEPWAAPGVSMTILPDGDLLSVDIAVGQSVDPATGVRENDYLIRRHLAAEGRTHSFGDWPGVATLIKRVGGFEGAWLMPFGVETVVAADRDRVFIGSTGSDSILVFDRVGERTGTIRRDPTALQVTPEGRQEMIERLVASSPSRSAADTREILGAAPIPATVPTAGRILVDDRGLLWVSPYWQPGLESLQWEVWDATGKQHAVVAIPAAVQPLSIEGTSILGVTEDDDGRELVVRYSLELADN